MEDMRLQEDLPGGGVELYMVEEPVLVGLFISGYRLEDEVWRRRSQVLGGETWGLYIDHFDSCDFHGEARLLTEYEEHQGGVTSG